MKQILLAVISLILLLPQIGAATGFEVTKVVEVGQASNLSYIGALAWSPDGSKLAFFSGGSFYVSDTLGNVEEVGSLEFSPHRFEWWSDTELILQQTQHISGKESRYRLLTFNVLTGKVDTLEQFQYISFEKTHESFKGPFRTNKGDAYYISDRDGERKVVFSETNKNAKDLDQNPIPNLLYDAIGDTLITISSDFQDTAAIGLLHERGRIRFSVKASVNGRYVVANYDLYDLSDSSSIQLPNHAKEQLALNVDACSVGINTHFNPIYDELMVELSCETFVEDVHRPTEYVFTVLYDLTEGTFQNLSSALNSDNCGAPSYSPDGLKIAVLSNNTAYIIFRELTK